jgi:sugar phosphate isomerase/epimerase
MGFDGCDLTVRPGGHVIPERSAADLVRAIEGIRDEGVTVAIVTTALTSPTDYNSRQVLGLSGRMGVPYFKPGYWRYAPNEPVEAALARVKRDMMGLAAIGRDYGIAAGFHNHSGDYVGEATWDTREILADLDPRWAGYYFDPCHATAEGGLGGWKIALRLALARLKMAALKDFYWEKAGGRWSMKMCPMGQGMVDWPAFFGALAAAKFTGPLSLHMEYEIKDELSAMARDLEFVRRQMSAAYGG